MKKMQNMTHIEGYLYSHTLELKVSGENSKNPGTQFISGNIEIATDNALLNIVPVHFTYVTTKTAKGNPNATFDVLNKIISGQLKSVMHDGVDQAAKLRVDSAINLNDFYSDRNGQEELVSAKRNEGGFVHVTQTLSEKECDRNTFKCDMLITSVAHIDADEEKNTKEKVIVRGYIFDFRNAILPVEFSVIGRGGMRYFEDLEPSSKNPVFTSVWGNQISETVIRKIVQESAFGEDSVREVTNSRKDWVIMGSAKELYLWDDESTLTANEVTKAVADREIYLATVKQRSDEYKASKNGTAVNSSAFAGNFDF